MADSVPHDGGELGLGPEVGHQPAGHEDVPARKGKGIDDRVIDDLECPRKVRALRLGGELLAQLRHVALRSRVVVNPDALGNVGGARVPISISCS